MKKLIIIAALLTAFTAAQAQTPTTADVKTAKTEKAAETKTPATDDATAKKEDNTSAFVGTNDFYLALVREGVKKG